MPDLPLLMRTDGSLEARLIGIRKASTFTGFCAKHDKEFFSDLEDHTFTASPKQIFLLGYRALAMEVYKKRSSVKMAKSMKGLDQGKSPLTQLGIQNIISGMAEGSELGLRDMQSHRAEFDDVWSREAWGELQYLVIEFDKEPTIASSAVFTPEFDFSGNPLQQWGDGGPAPDYFCFSLIPTERGGAAVWCWLGNRPASSSFVESIVKLKDSVLASAIVQFAFECIENTYGSPDWWESLEVGAQVTLLERMHSIPWEQGASDALVPDGTSYADWLPTSLNSNVLRSEP